MNSKPPDYQKLPLNESLRDTIAVEKVILNNTITIENINFLVSDVLQQKLVDSKLSGPLSLDKLRKYLKQDVKEDTNYQNFWSPTHFEKELLNYYCDAVRTPATLLNINNRYDDFFTKHSLAKSLKLEKKENILIYFAKIIDSPLPEDQISIQFINMHHDHISEIHEKINKRIDFQCNGILFQDCIEIHGIIKHIKSRIQSLE